MNDYEQRRAEAKARDSEFRRRLAAREYRMVRQGAYFFICDESGQTVVKYHRQHPTKPDTVLGHSTEQMEAVIIEIENSEPPVLSTKEAIALLDSLTRKAP